MDILKGKKGDLLIGDIIFLVLNLVFLSILVIFIISKTNDASRLEEQYAKQIALVLDSARPGMTIIINMQDAIEKATKEKQDFANIVKINGNIITVKLKEKGGYSYSFFNDVHVNSYFDTSNNKGDYVLIVDERQ